ncbi:MAG: glycosyltransferase family 39 protein [Cyanobacteriota/Melainabacteria group bacterium]
MEKTKRLTVPSSSVCIIILLPLLAFLLRLWFAFFDGHLTCVTALDASEYVRNAETLQAFADKPFQFWLDSLLCLSGFAPPDTAAQIHTDYKPLAELVSRSGPIYPLFLLLCFSLGGHSIGDGNLNAALIAQCFLSAMATLLIYLSASKIFNRRAGLWAGLLSALYPGFIINSARLISESFATFWICLIIACVTLLLTRAKFNPYLALLTGFSLGILQLTRSALVVVTILTIFLGLCFIKERKAQGATALAVLGLGGALAILYALNFLVTGTGSIVVDRLSHYNLLIGMNLESLGWLAFPLPNLALVENRSYLDLIMLSFNQNWLQSSLLLLDKVPRLFAIPFNDFQNAIGIFGKHDLIIFHQVCLALAVAGICARLLTRDGTERLTAKCFVLSIIAVHLAYIFFVALPRYALTALPCFLIFAGAGMDFIIEALQEKSSRNKTIALLGCTAIFLILVNWGALFVTPFNHLFLSLSILILLKLAIFTGIFALLFKLTTKNSTTERSRKLLVCCTVAIGLAPLAILPLKAYGPIEEWRAPLNAESASVEQTIRLESNLLDNYKTRKNFILIDCRDWSTLGRSTVLSVNGQVLEDAVIPAMSMIDDLSVPKTENNADYFYDFESVLSSMMRTLDGTNLNLRQWFMVPLPESIIEEAVANRQGDLKVSLKVLEGLETSVYGSSILKRNQVIMPGLHLYSWEKLFYGLENPDGLGDARYQIKFAKKELLCKEEDLSSLPGLQSGNYHLRILSLPLSGDDAVKEKRATSVNNEISSGLKKVIHCEPVPDYTSHSMWTVTVRARIDSELQTKVSLPITCDLKVKSVNQGREIQYSSPWTPSRLELLPGENHFRFSILFKPSALPGTVKEVQFLSSPGGRAEGRELFGIGQKSLLELEKNSLRSPQIRWKQLSLEINETGVDSGLAGYQIN